jgi:hypothetical protein
MKAELCPVCRGSGKYPYIIKPNPFLDPSKSEEPKNVKQHDCHGCNGRGWISLPEDPPHPIFFPPKDKLRRQIDRPDHNYRRLTT